MERGVFIGGILMSTSLLIALLLNSKSHPETVAAPPVTATTTARMPALVVPRDTTANRPLRMSSHVASATSQPTDSDSNAQPSAF